MIIHDLDFFSSSEEEYDNGYFAIQGGASASVSAETSANNGAVSADAFAKTTGDNSAAVAVTGVKLIEAGGYSAGYGAAYGAGYGVSHYTSFASDRDHSSSIL